MALAVPRSSDSSWRRRRFELALGVAALGHWLLSLAPIEPHATAMASTQRADFEVELLPEEEDELAATVSGPAGDALPEGNRDAIGRGTPPPPAPLEQPRAEVSVVASDPMDGLSMDGARQAEPPGDTGVPRRPVRLFLGRSDLREFSRGTVPKTRAAVAPEAPPTSVGMLTEGLQAADAEKGLSGSSAAVSASYRAARLGPRSGTAVFEIRADARGSVTSVRVVGDAGDGPWSNVAVDLLARLKDRLLRLPAGAKGLVTRLRIDRGDLAQDLSERGKTKRGVAIGQDHHPKDFGWDESTQGSSRPSRLSPTLGVSSDDLRSSIKTRVQLLSEQRL